MTYPLISIDGHENEFDLYSTRTGEWEILTNLYPDSYWVKSGLQLTWACVSVNHQLIAHLRVCFTAVTAGVNEK